MAIDKRALETLEDLPLRPLDAWYILLVYLGLKSGAWALVKSDVWREGDEPREVCKSTLDLVEASLERLGLVYHIELRTTDLGLWQPDDGSRQRLNQIADIYVAKERDVLDNIVLARKNSDHRLLGLSLGYPETAVEAFETDRKIFVKDLEPEVRSSDAGRLTYFALSKDNWRKELDVVEAWIEAVKNNSPILWGELGSSRRKS